MFKTMYLLLIVALSCVSYSAQESQLKVVVYAEGLCPDCLAFMEGQLYPAYQKLGDSLLIDFIPFGKAVGVKTDEGWNWECQHGPIECFVNKVDACAISLKAPQSQLLNFLNCETALEEFDDLTLAQTTFIVKKCANDNKFSWDDINQCITDGRADTLLAAYQERQRKLDPPINFIPNIRFNDVFDQKLQDSARNDFLSTVCSLFNGTKPSACDGEF